MGKAELKIRKQEVVRQAIYEAAIPLFSARGFDETTVEEIASAAGVSQRSFFRYYVSKDDLLAQSVIEHGIALAKCLAACPLTDTEPQLLRKVVLVGIENAAHQPLTREIIEISLRSISARRAHVFGFVDVEDRLSEEYARRFKSGSGNASKSRVFAQLAISLIKTATLGWFTQEYSDLHTSLDQVFANLSSLICERNTLPLSTKGMKAENTSAGRSGVKKAKKSKV